MIFCNIVDFEDVLTKLLFRNIFPIDLYSFQKAENVWRCVKPCLIASFLQNISSFKCNRSLPICTRDVNSLKRILRIVKFVKQFPKGNYFPRD